MRIQIDRLLSITDQPGLDFVYAFLRAYNSES